MPKPETPSGFEGLRVLSLEISPCWVSGSVPTVRSKPRNSAYGLRASGLWVLLWI